MRSIVERRTFRLGILVLAISAMNLSLAFTMPDRELALWPWLVSAVTGAVGIGLLVVARVARIVAGLGVALAGVLLLVSSSEMPGALIRLARLDDWTPLVALTNPVVTTALSLWFCIRAIQVLLGRQWAATLVTARLTGAALAVIAAHHLWFAAAMRIGLGLESIGITISVSPGGTQLAGFPGWPIWHVVLAILALLMLAGSPRLIARAATLLVVWCACLPVLVLIDAPQLGMQMVAFAGLLTLAFTYLAWWLRDEVHRRVRDLAMVAAPPAAPS